jgi:hypothetical protein
MRVLFIATTDPRQQGDYLELSLIHGFRSVLGDNFVEYPKKKILYGDFSDTPKNTLHGKGFTYCTTTIKDVSYDRNNIKVKDFDVIIVGSGPCYGETYSLPEHSNIWYTDGHDLYGVGTRMIEYNGDIVIGSKYTEKCFKRELLEEFPTVFPTGFGIPANKIQPINFDIKKKIFQSTAPPNACFRENSTQKFDNENEYYKDLAESWFGLTCRKGGWDCLRHYEIMAAGTLLLFCDYNSKPINCQPKDFPTLSYSNQQELNSLITTLVVDNKPTKQYINLLNQQREWLLQFGTCEARAIEILKILHKFIV